MADIYFEKPTHLVYWAIRQKSTGWWLPCFDGKQKRGFTYTEPSERAQPRLFTRLQDAKLAFRWWLKGKYQVTYGYDFEGGDTVHEKITPQSHRKADDYEIVCLSLVEWVKEQNNARQ